MRIFDRFPLRYVVPNAVTCVGLVLGLCSIVIALSASSRADFEDAAWLILWCTLLDKLDGTIARRIGAQSEFGIQLDSFSDFVTFGLAPAALVHGVARAAFPHLWSGPFGAVLLAALSVLYVLAAVLRLAKFNIQTGVNNPAFFLGLPSTSSGGILAAAYLTHLELELPPWGLHVLTGWMVVHAVLMVTNLPLPKLRLGKGKLWRAFQIANIGAAYVFVPLRFAPQYLLLVSVAYVLIGFGYGLAVAEREGLGSVGEARPTAPPAQA